MIAIAYNGKLGDVHKYINRILCFSVEKGYSPRDFNIIYLKKIASKQLEY